MSIIKKLLVVAAVMLLWAGMVHAQTQNPTTITPTVNPSNAILPPCDSTNPNADCYTLLEALPTSDPTKDITSIDVNGTGNSEGIGGFINFAMELGIGIAGILGVVMLVVYGFQYAANDQNVGNFEVVKGKITKVVLGLMLLLGITIILRTINPDLLVVEPQMTTVELKALMGPEVNNYSAQDITTITSQVSIGNVTGDGVVTGLPKLVNKITPVVEKQGLRKVKAIIMHGTAGGSASSALATWISNRVTGAHFIIDYDGAIWQTVRINKRANHFVPNAAGNSLGISNYSTIGIEIVQKYDYRNKTWEIPTQQQVQSGAVLVKYLLTTFSLRSTDVYGHGQVGQHRTADEGLAEISKILPLIR